MSPAYEELLRDVARRNIQVRPLTGPEIAVVIDEFRDLPGEALGDAPELFVEALKLDAPVSLSAMVMVLLRRRCEAYIASDVKDMRDTIEAEERNEDEYTGAHA